MPTLLNRFRNRISLGFLIVRVLFMLWLCNGIRDEAGPYTAIAVFFLFVVIEFVTAYLRRANQLAGEAIRRLGG